MEHGHSTKNMFIEYLERDKKYDALAVVGIIFFFKVVHKINCQQVSTHVSGIKKKNVLREKIIEVWYLNGVIAIFLVGT